MEVKREGAGGRHPSRKENREEEKEVHKETSWTKKEEDLEKLEKIV